MAGYYDVPVIFVAGDKAVCDQARELLGNVETVAVKEGIGAAALNLHPEVAHHNRHANDTALCLSVTSCAPLEVYSSQRHAFA